MTSQWGGLDTVTIRGAQGNDWLVVDQRNVRVFDTQGQVQWADGFQRVNVDLGNGHDIANFMGSSQVETLHVNRTETDFQNMRQRVVVTNSDETRFSGSGDNDELILEQLNLLQSLGDQAVAFLDQHRITAQDIAFLEARSVDDAMAEYDLDVVDFQYLLRGNWRPR
jgi:hypothetical protein